MIFYYQTAEEFLWPVQTLPIPSQILFCWVTPNPVSASWSQGTKNRASVVVVALVDRLKAINLKALILSHMKSAKQPNLSSPIVTQGQGILKTFMQCTHLPILHIQEEVNHSDPFYFCMRLWQPYFRSLVTFTWPSSDWGMFLSKLGALTLLCPLPNIKKGQKRSKRQNHPEEQSFLLQTWQEQRKCQLAKFCLDWPDWS